MRIEPAVHTQSHFFNLASQVSEWTVSRVAKWAGGYFALSLLLSVGAEFLSSSCRIGPVVMVTLLAFGLIIAVGCAAYHLASKVARIFNDRL
ncbi:MAG TPA: hypothetical protein VGJ00_05230 [Rhabdochlamydiaceae bacterium]|jgi:hypothetical protein